jgi:hypothetical protein
LNVDDVSPKSIHGYITRAYATMFELSMDASVTDESVQITVQIP